MRRFEKGQTTLLETSSCDKKNEMHKLKIELLKFLIIGVINFVFTFILFFLLVKIILIDYLISLIVVSFVGMILTYSLNHIWVFKPEGNLTFGIRLVKYIFSGTLSIALNVVVLKHLVDLTNYDPFYVQMALIPLIVIFNFSAAKLWSLRAFRDDVRK